MEITQTGAGEAKQRAINHSLLAKVAEIVEKILPVCIYASKRAAYSDD